MTVVEPAAGVLFGEADAEGIARSERLVVDVRAIPVPPAMSVEVEGVEVVVGTQDVHGHVVSQACPESRCIARVGAAVHAVEAIPE